MVPDELDAFCAFAKKCAVDLTASDINAAPRDVTAAPDELERYTLVTITKGVEFKSVRMLFVGEQLDRLQPTIRDVLWWLASDSWAIEKAGRDISNWAALYGHPLDTTGTSRAFHLHAAQADALCDLLGESDYQALLAIYQAELAEG